MWSMKTLFLLPLIFLIVIIESINMLISKGKVLKQDWSKSNSAL